MKIARLNQLSINVTPELIDQYIEKFDEDNGIEDRALGKVFTKFPNNNSIDEVIIKVALLNQFYSTQILNKNIRIVANHIVEIENLDDLLKKGDIDAVSQIIKMPNGYNDLHSFASKYCSFSNSDKYPIKDNIARAVLFVIGKSQKFTKMKEMDEFAKLNDYKIDYYDFKKVVDMFISIVEKEYNIKYSYKDIDKFLWKYGKDKNVGFGEEIKFN